MRPVLLLTARHREVIDQLLKRGDFRRHVQERLAPRVVALAGEAAEELQALLADEGIFLEGDAPRAEGGAANGSASGAALLAPNGLGDAGAEHPEGVAHGDAPAGSAPPEAPATTEDAAADGDAEDATAPAAADGALTRPLEPSDRCRTGSANGR